jgi:hypothetical protein
MHFVIQPGAANRLAYYKAEEGLGVLAPRGWFCFATYGSSGDNLYVVPHPIHSKELFSSDWKGFRGPAVQLSASVGDTSGRFEVARIIARVFPARQSFVDQVIDEALEPKTDFPSGPYPADKLSYKSPDIVEYTTPPLTQGLGTDSRLLPDAAPIHGAEIISGEETNLISVAVRLPVDMAALATDILKQVEVEATH